MKLNKLMNIVDYVYTMGFSWLIFRIKYYFQLKYNYFVKNDLKIIQKTTSLEQLDLPLWLDIYAGSISQISQHIQISDNAIEGKVRVFSHDYLDYKNPKQSHYNPITDINVDNNIHWSKIPDFGTLGDIKIPWEFSRFPHFYSYIKAHKITKEKKYMQAFIDDMNLWLSQNEFPSGMNFKCGQEMTFRVFSILIALNYFKPFLDRKFIDKLAKYFVTSGYRIEENIDYAVISVKNDHAISEAVGLIIFGLMFYKQIPDAKNWLATGRKILLDELNKQVYSDGSYLCHSFIYQREVLDELSLLLLILKKNYPEQKELIESITSKNTQMVQFLYSFTQKNGFLPNYGSNDGANLFPIMESDYRDFRCHLNFASAVANSTILFDTHLDLIDLFSITDYTTILPQKQHKFEDGGYYILNNSNLFLFTRCHTYRDRPSQNDMLHLDVWHKGINIFCDTGTYSYNTNKTFQNNFTGVLGHNTIMINDTNQMQQVLNFGYSNWTKSKCIEFSSNSFTGENYAYKKDFGITHKRHLELTENEITIKDIIHNVSSKTNIKQIWNTKYKIEIIDKTTLRVKDCIISSNIPYRIEDSYISNYYNSYTKGTRIIFETETDIDYEIETKMELLNETTLL